MTVRGNGNKLIADCCFPRTFIGKEASVICPSKHLNTSQYEVFLAVASADELEHDVLLLSTKRLIHENT